ncbi:hypothetical protein GYMLUDRAFT_131495, partial [Collybiopsis luxurians FD-317 M1]
GKTNSGIICDNCKWAGHVKAKCWARGGGSEGKAPHWYHAPKGMEPIAVTSASATQNVFKSGITAAATIYDFGDYDF